MATDKALLEGILARVAEAMASSEYRLPPQGTVSDCGVRCLLALLSVYVSNGEGGRALAEELDALGSAFYRKDDEVVEAMGVTELMMTKAVINTLRQKRKAVNRGSAEAAEGESVTGEQERA